MVNREVAPNQAREPGSKVLTLPVQDGVANEFEDVEAMMAASADMITMATAEGEYRYVSPASQRLFKWDPAHLVGCSQEQFAHPDDVESMRASPTDRLDRGRIARRFVKCIAPL